MFSQNNELKILKLKRRLAELNQRIDTSRNWTNGELEIFKQQIRTMQLELIDLEYKKGIGSG